MHKSEVFFYILAAFMAGVFVGSFWTISNYGLLVLVLIGIIILAISAYQGTFSQTSSGILKRKIGALMGILILIFTFGIFRFNNFDTSRSILNEFTDVEVGDDGLPVTLVGYVDSDPEDAGNKSRFVFKAKGIVADDRILLINERVLVNADRFPEHTFGDPLILTGALKEPQNFRVSDPEQSRTDDNDFDYITYLKRDGIRTILSFPEIEKRELISLDFLENLKLNIYRSIFSIKRNFESTIDKHILEPNASYINGILLGTRQNIPDDLKEAFNKTSTTHVLAISGYNIMIISWAVLMLFIYFFKRRTAFWISVLVIIFFTIMTGASASVVRASIMGLLLLFAQGYGRLYDTRNSIILAGALMVFINPFVLVFDIGFQLSFLAVMGLIYLYPVLNFKLKKIPALGGMKEITLMTLSAQIFVLPLLVYYFNNFSIVSLPANVMILPFVPYAMLLGFLTGILGMFFAPVGGFLAQIAGFIAWAITNFQLNVIQYFSRLPFASTNVSISWIVMLILYGLLILFLYRARKLSKTVF
jgi:competence protein ComEC